MLLKFFIGRCVNLTSGLTNTIYYMEPSEGGIQSHASLANFENPCFP